MADLTVTSSSGPVTDSLDSLTWTNASGSGDKFTFTGQEILLVRNDSGSNQTVTINSTEDDLGRKEDISSETVSGDTKGTVKFIELTQREGWIDSNGEVTVSASSTDIEYAILKLSDSA